MARKVADLLWEMLVNAGVKRCYGIVGDALNPVSDALRRNGNVDFVHVRNEEYGVFAAVADAYLTGAPVAVCGTAGPGVVHLFNGLMDAFFQGEAGIRDWSVTGVQTCALPISCPSEARPRRGLEARDGHARRARLPRAESAGAAVRGHPGLSAGLPRDFRLDQLGEAPRHHQDRKSVV